MKEENGGEKERLVWKKFWLTYVRADRYIPCPFFCLRPRRAVGHYHSISHSLEGTFTQAKSWCKKPILYGNPKGVGTLKHCILILLSKTTKHIVVGIVDAKWVIANALQLPMGRASCYFEIKAIALQWTWAVGHIVLIQTIRLKKMLEKSHVKENTMSS